MPRFVLLAALALLMAVSAFAQKQDPDHIGPATIVPACTKTTPPPCASTPPKVTHQPDAKYPKEARKHKIEGIVVLYLVVGTDGRTHNIGVVRSLGYGLDEAAIEAVKKWKFRPALTEQRVPVPVAIEIEIRFHL